MNEKEIIELLKKIAPAVNTIYGKLLDTHEWSGMIGVPLGSEMHSQLKMYEDIYEAMDKVIKMDNYC